VDGQLWPPACRRQGLRETLEAACECGFAKPFLSSTQRRYHPEPHSSIIAGLAQIGSATASRVLVVIGGPTRWPEARVDGPNSAHRGSTDRVRPELSVPADVRTVPTDRRHRHLSRLHPDLTLIHRHRGLDLATGDVTAGAEQDDNGFCPAQFMSLTT
jgi:hypothetical protein